MAVISLEALQKSPDSNVRFCLDEFRECPGRKADIRICFLLESLTVRQEMLSTIPPSTLSAAPVVALAWGEAA